MDATLFLGLFVLLSMVYLYIGYQTSKHVHSLDDYFLAGRSLTLAPLTIALVATHLGGGIILGTSQQSYLYGWYGMLYVAGIVAGFLLLAGGCARRMRAFGVGTVPEIIKTWYCSPLLARAASLVSILSLAGILSAQIVASKNIMLSLGVYNPLLFVAFWVLVIAYTMAGGLSAVVKNDVIQLSFIMVVFAILCGYDIIQDPHTITTLLATDTPAHIADLFSYQDIIAIVVPTALYSLIEQDIAQTIFAAATPRIAFIGSLAASIIMTVFACIPVYFGMKAALLKLVVPISANPLLVFIDTYYPPLLVTLVAYGIFAAIISTADAVLCAISSHLVRDFDLASRGTYAVRVAKLVTALVGTGALIAGSYAQNIIAIIVGSYDIPVAMIWIPLMAAYFGLSRSTWGAWASIVSGGTAFVLAKIMPTLFLTWCPAVILHIGVSLIAYACGAVLQQVTNARAAQAHSEL